MMVSIVLIIMGTFKLCKDVNIAYIITHYWINCMVFIGFMGILYSLMKPLLDKGGSKTMELLKMFFFYIPCLWIDLIEYVKTQYKITTPTIWILLLMEIILIVSYFLLPYLIKKIKMRDGTLLQGPPIYLNNENVIGTYENLHKEREEKNPNKTEKNIYIYNYAISCWFYLNPQPQNTSEAYTKFSNIINYGKRPIVEYNGKTNTLRVQSFINNDRIEEIYSTDKILYQKWNNLVINCDGGNMDVFINNELVANKTNITPFMNHEKIIVGSKKGIHGGICNVVYHENVLT